ncbi:hypothetical protein IV203_033754 [Nitzschia inconspicua]|uniref:YchJ-like middle NTF2-like domain-containing protein n=1 Tax=Nitzschia inconspicua TaxID=303405 RepID=A0A9K3Q7A5_9STRA|nr:hypothetical protein IV203_033754 [Nitzschia inconspicua]
MAPTNHSVNFMLLLVVLLTTASLLLPPTQGFAAAARKKKNNNKNGGGGGSKNNKKASSTASTTRGFAAPPPTLDQTLASFRTRLPDNDDPATVPCPCGIYGTSYAECCQPYHLGELQCTTPLSVLQTRYSAFTYRLIGHIIATTHPNCREYMDDKIAWANSLNKNGMFDSFDFVGLQVLKEEQEHQQKDEEHSGLDPNVAYIDFQVTLRGRSSTTANTATITNDAVVVAGKETVVQERSQFLKDTATGVWTYSGGDVRSQVQGLEDTQLNT